MFELPNDWHDVLRNELRKPYIAELRDYVAEERRAHEVFPAQQDVFRAFQLTPFQQVRVLLLGQDPYHDHGQAHGLCFSVPEGTPPPPSLRNMFKELEADLGLLRPDHGNLTQWAKEGVLLLNSVLTVRAHEAASHKNHGWEQFTDAVIQALAAREAPVVFLLWGTFAKKKAKWIRSPHVALLGTHPSPLSAYRGFFGSRPFSQVNRELKRLNLGQIRWRP